MQALRQQSFLEELSPLQLSCVSSTPVCRIWKSGRLQWSSRRVQRCNLARRTLFDKKRTHYLQIGRIWLAASVPVPTSSIDETVGVRSKSWYIIPSNLSSTNERNQGTKVWPWRWSSESEQPILPATEEVFPPLWTQKIEWTHFVFQPLNNEFMRKELGSSEIRIAWVDSINWWTSHKCWENPMYLWRWLLALLEHVLFSYSWITRRWLECCQDSVMYWQWQPQSANFTVLEGIFGVYGCAGNVENFAVLLQAGGGVGPILCQHLTVKHSTFIQIANVLDDSLRIMSLALLPVTVVNAK